MAPQLLFPLTRVLSFSMKSSALDYMTSSTVVVVRHKAIQEAAIEDAVEKATSEFHSAPGGLMTFEGKQPACRRLSGFGIMLRSSC